MKKIILCMLFMLVLSSTALAAESDEPTGRIGQQMVLLKDLYVTKGEGDYSEYQKLNGYPKQNKFQIYYKDNSKGSVISCHVVHEDLRGINYDEVWDFKLPNGTPVKITKGNVFSIFLKYENTDVGQYLKSVFPGAYDEWFEGLCFSSDAERLVMTFLEYSYGHNTKRDEYITIVPDNTSSQNTDLDGNDSSADDRGAGGGILGSIVGLLKL